MSSMDAGEAKEYEIVPEKKARKGRRKRERKTRTVQPGGYAEVEDVEQRKKPKS